MTNNNQTTQPKKKFKKFLLLGVLFLAAIPVLSHLVWVYSGSNQWELEIDKNEVKVYSLKAPGSKLKKFKGIARFKSDYKLSHIVAAMADTDVETCAEWIPGCASGESIEVWNSQDRYFVHLWQVNPPSPFSPREFLLRTQFSQDPQSKGIIAEFTAVPDRIPENECCVRVTDMHNIWRYTPLDSGEIEVEFVQDMDLGGFMPYFMFNYASPIGIHAMLFNLPKFFDKEKYQSAEYDFIEEVPINR